MKKTILIFAMAMFGFAMVFAQSVTKPAAQKSIVVYFTYPEDLATAELGVDAVLMASVLPKSKKPLTEFVAEIVQKEIASDIFKIERVEKYPVGHSKLLAYARTEITKNQRPKIKAVPNLDAYDTVVIGFPNWWTDFPAPVYTFFDSVNLDGKNIYLFCTHGGSGLSNTLQKIRRYKPNAKISSETLAIYRGDVEASENKIREWARKVK